MINLSRSYKTITPQDGDGSYGSGNDTLIGGSGYDKCYGGPGTDTQDGCEKWVE